MSIRAMFVGNSPAAANELKPAAVPAAKALQPLNATDPATLPTGEAAAPAVQPVAVNKPAAKRPTGN